MNTYTYANNDPLRFTDPEGLFVPAIIPIVEGAINAIGAVVIWNAANNINSGSRSIPNPEKPNCGCTCICRANANDNIFGNLKPGDPKFAFGKATAGNCAEASKEAKRKAIHALGKQPKHVGCRCNGS